MEGSSQRPARLDPAPPQVSGNFEVSPEHKDQAGTPLAPPASGKRMALSQFIWPCPDPASALLTQFIGKPQGA